jgi:hypothetical protein
MLKELETLIPRDRISNGGKVISRERFLELIKQNPETIIGKEFSFNDGNGSLRQGKVQNFNVDSNCIKFFLDIESRLEEHKGTKSVSFNPYLYQSEIILGDSGVEFHSFREQLRINL